jgi:hypothetical protein
VGELHVGIYVSVNNVSLEGPAGSDAAAIIAILIACHAAAKAVHCTECSSARMLAAAAAEVSTTQAACPRLGTKAGLVQTPPHLSLLVSPRMMYSSVCLSMSAAMLFAGSVAAFCQRCEQAVL